MNIFSTIDFVKKLPKINEPNIIIDYFLHYVYDIITGIQYQISNDGIKPYSELYQMVIILHHNENLEHILINPSLEQIEKVYDIL